MQTLELVAVAWLGAVLSTIPIGPMNLVLLSFIVSHRERLWLAMTAGIVVVDIAVAMAAWFLTEMARAEGHNFFATSHPRWEMASLAVLIAILIISGVTTLQRGLQAATAEKAPPSYLRTALSKTPMLALLFAFGSGALGTLLEPALPFFWGAWWLKFFHQPTPLTITSGTMVVSGILIGDVMVFASYRLIARKMARSLPKTYLSRLEKIVGSALLLVASFLCWHLLRKIYMEAFS